MVLEKNKHIGSVVFMAAAFAGAALLSFSTLGSVTAPVCCGLAGALSPGYAAAVFAGSTLTYLISGSAEKSGFIICSLLLILIGKWLMRDENIPKFCAAVTFLSMVFSGIVFGALVDRSMLSVLENILISVLTGISAFFIKQAYDFLYSSDTFRLEKRNFTAFAVVYTLAVSALCGISFSVINAGRIAGTVIILWAAKKFRHSGGVISGVLTTAGIFISSPELGIPSAFLGIAGLAAGYAADYSRITVAAAFLAVDFCGQLLTGMNDASFCMQADAVLGAVIFMLLPGKVIMTGGMVFDGDSSGGDSEVVRTEMEFAAMSLVDVRKNVEEIIDVLEKKSVPYSVINEVSTRVCGKCRNKLNCWEKNYDKTNSCFMKIERQKVLDTEYFPSGLDCCRRHEIIENFARCRKEEAVNKMMSARLNESRNFLFSQMETTENIISSISENLKFKYSQTMTRNLCSILSKYEIYYTTAIAYYNQNEKLIAEIYTKDTDSEDLEEISDILSRELHIPMEFSEPVSCSGESRLRFNQQTKYKIQYASAQNSAEEGQPSGDCCGFFCDGLGNAYIFISDGMGSGSQAAVDSRIVSNLFRRLVRSGIECSAAVKLINSIMLTKSSEESFATLDIGKINLETCELTLYKSGAASTLIKYTDSVMMFNSPSNPIGIIPDSRISQRTCNFNEEDVLVMLSDGVDESMYSYIKEQLQTVYDLKTITENVCSEARKKFTEKPEDDITVAAARVILRE